MNGAGHPDNAQPTLFAVAEPDRLTVVLEVDDSQARIGKREALERALKFLSRVYGIEARVIDEGRS